VKKALILLLFLTGCSYTVKEGAFCSKYEPKFVCSYGVDVLAICDTLEECNKTCAEERAK